MSMTFLQDAPIDSERLIAQVAASDHGAVVTFAGNVRNIHAGRGVVSLAYSAYRPMAEAVCTAIVAEAGERWPVTIALVHRLGEIAVGETAVVVAAASAHRDAAFAACRWVIDQVKERVPIWKRERYADGTELWVDPTAPEGVVMPQARP
jgi:molybdopterin synthase catalytic subunit